jgi:hypothetical protein
MGVFIISKKQKKLWFTPFFKTCFVTSLKIGFNMGSYYFLTQQIIFQLHIFKTCVITSLKIGFHKRSCYFQNQFSHQGYFLDLHITSLKNGLDGGLVIFNNKNQFSHWGHFLNLHSHKSKKWIPHGILLFSQNHNTLDCLINKCNIVMRFSCTKTIISFECFNL